MTVGSSPLNDRMKKLRTVALRACDASKLPRYQASLDWCAKHMIREMWAEAQANGGVVDPVPIMRRTAQNMSIGVQFGVGTQVAQETYSPKNLKAPMRALNQYVLSLPILPSFPTLINFLCSFRSVHGRLQDYLPWLQFSWIPEEKIFKDALVASRGRNDGLDRLVTAARDAYAIGELKDCAIKVMLDDAKVELAQDELISVSSSMISSGIGMSPCTPYTRTSPDLIRTDWHMPNSLLWSLAAMAKDPKVQTAAYESVLRKNSDPEIKARNAEHDHEDYVMAIVKEVGRYFDVLRIAPSRSTVKDIVWKGYFIPSGTTVFLNSHAVNRGI
jgi:3-hydroxyphenylacetate 6-hydroxylase